MTLNNKLKIAILTILSSQTLQALTLEPIQVQSGAGNLLYAEIKFSQAAPGSTIEAGLAEAQDLMRIGVTHQSPAHLNFYTRRSSDGTGVIVITSIRPMMESELNLLLKIREGDATHIHQIRAPLAQRASKVEPHVNSSNDVALIPQMIVSEQDIALQLPSSAEHKPLLLQSTPVPIMSVSKAPALTEQHAIAVLPRITSPTQVTNKVDPIQQIKAQSAPSVVAADMNKTHTPIIHNESNKVKTSATESTTTTVTTHPVGKTLTPSPASVEQIEAEVEASMANQNQSKEIIQKTEPANQTPPKNTPETTTGRKSVAPVTESKNSHIVQANESLWKIAAKIAAQTNQSIPDVMKKLKENNQHAFINGNSHRIRQGVAINLAAGYQAKSTYSATKQFKKPQKSTQKPSAKAKYRLNQAEMSLVVENSTATKSRQKKENLLVSPTTQELSSKVMTAREKTVKLQKSVSQSTLALRNKDQRIHLLNERLALLQQQLQQQNQTERSVN